MSKETGTVKADGVKILGETNSPVTQSKFVRMTRDGIIQSVPKKEVETFNKKGFTVVIEP